MHLLPLSLGRLADHADRPGAFAAARYATNSVFLRLNGDNTFEAVATNTNALVRVTGPCVALAGEYPLFPELESAPDDGTLSALIPASAWRRSTSSSTRSGSCRRICWEVAPSCC